MEGEEGGEGQQPGGAMGFAAGLMMKARGPKIYHRAKIYARNYPPDYPAVT